MVNFALLHNIGLPDVASLDAERAMEAILPSIILFAPTGSLDQAAVHSFAQAATRLSTEVLLAAVENVQIVLVPTGPPPVGPPGYIEVKFRKTPARDDAVMQRFMGGLDAAAIALFGAKLRIRCFAYDAAGLFARN